MPQHSTILIVKLWGNIVGNWMKCHNLVHNQYFKKKQYVFQKNCHLCDWCCDNCGWSSTIVVFCDNCGWLRQLWTLWQLWLHQMYRYVTVTNANWKHVCLVREFGTRYNFASSTVVAQCSFLQMISFRCGWMYGQNSQVWPEC